MEPLWLIKLEQLDPSAADYVRNNIEEKRINQRGASLITLFSWCHTLQGHAYWEKLHYEILKMPNITALGNKFDGDNNE